MGGGLMQLVAYGAQDIYLTGNPQITFFKVVYRRHTNFSMEAIEQTFNGTPGFGSRVTATISRNGDLVHRMYVEWSPLLFQGTNNIQHACANMGNALIKEVEIEIGGQKIDKHYGHWLTTWSDLTEKNTNGTQMRPTADTGGEGIALHGTKLQMMSYNHQGFAANGNASIAPASAFIPLQFWFCRNPGLALPLIALQYHEVKVKILFPPFSDLTTATQTFSPCKLWCDYIYLDTDERRRFAQVSHEYLIEQLQFQKQSSGLETKTDLNFNHPVKELIWTGVPRQTGPISTEFKFASVSTPGMIGTAVAAGATLPATDKFKLTLNGHERFAERHAYYFTRNQVWQHHTGFGGTTQRNSIAVYSFALKPEEHQPSGTCNFSRIDNAQLTHPAMAATAPAQATRRGRDDGMHIYAVNYNVLRIMSGMGGLAYSN